MVENTMFKEYLKNNPKKTGYLFTILLLLTQVGTVAASNKEFYAGP
jgi:hypothetical protein